MPGTRFPHQQSLTARKAERQSELGGLIDGLAKCVVLNSTLRWPLIEAVWKRSTSGGVDSTGIRSDSLMVDHAANNAAGASGNGNGNGNRRGNRGRTKTEGSADSTSTSTNALRFLERSQRPAQSLDVFPDTAAMKPWPVEPVSSQATARPRAWTLHSTHTPRLPRNSPLAFLERVPSTVSIASLVTGSGTDASLGSLGAGRVGSGGGRDEMSPIQRGSLDGPRARARVDEESDESEEDDNVCPSMIFSCLPCLACLRVQRLVDAIMEVAPSDDVGVLDRFGRGLDAHFSSLMARRCLHKTSLASRKERSHGPGKRRRRFEGDPLDGFNVRTDSTRSTSSLTTPLLGDQPLSPRDFPKDVKLIEVEVESARNLPLGEKESVAESAGTYVSLRMTPVQEGVGEQTEHTSIATRVVNPRWGGRERFTFFVTDTEHSKAMLALSLLYRPLQSSPQPPQPPSHRAQAASEANGAPVPSGCRPGDVVIGEGFVDLLGMFPVQNGTYTPGGLKGNSRRVAVPIREPVGKRRTKCSVMLGLRCRRVNETIDTHEDRLYEYQRWTRLAGWSSAGKQRVGKWSTVDGTVFTDDFAEIAPPAREDSEVVLPWCPFGGWEYSREDEATPPAATRNATGSNAPRRSQLTPNVGPEDWENFGVGQKGAVWMEGNVTGHESVRRRLWRRVYLDRSSSSLGLSGMTT